MSRPLPRWCLEGVAALLRYARKHSGVWDDACEQHAAVDAPDCRLPHEDDAALVCAGPILLAACNAVAEANSQCSCYERCDCFYEAFDLVVAALLAAKEGKCTAITDDR